MKGLPGWIILAVGAAGLWWLWKYLGQTKASNTILPKDPTKTPQYKAAVDQQLSASILDCQNKHGTWVANTNGRGGSCEGVNYTSPGGVHVTDDPSFIERVSGGNATGVYTGPPIPSAGTAYGQGGTTVESTGSPTPTYVPAGFGAH
jgi:hypothetical protein